MSWLKHLLRGKSNGQQIEPTEPVLSVELPADREPQQLYQDQIMRKAWVESVLEDRGIPVNKHLPCIEGEAETTLRTADEIAQRLFAVTVAAVRAEGVPIEDLDPVIAERDARSWFTPEEATFLTDTSPSDRDRIKFSWRYEAAWVLAWALKLVEDAPLGFPDRICNVERLASLVRDTPDLTAFGTQSTNNVLNEADLIYRYHWAVRQAQLDGQPAPGGLDPGIVVERHYALNWLVRYFDLDWDEVSTDT